MKTINEAKGVAGSLGYPAKMPGTSYGISAKACITGGKLAAVDGSVCHGCYAMKGNYLYPSIKQSHETRLQGLSSPAWVGAMVMMLNHAQSLRYKNNRKERGRFAKGYHRWHDSGDLQSVEHLQKICDVAAKTPHIKHWLPTRELGLVKAFQKGGGVVPKNLVIRVSATMIDGDASQAWPNTSTVHKDKRPAGRVCPAPSQDGQCGDCRACWNPRVKNVSYAKH